MGIKLKDLTTPDYALGAVAVLGLAWGVNAFFSEDERTCYQNADGQMVLVDTAPLASNPSQDEYKETVLPAGNTWRITSDGKCSNGDITIPVTPREQRKPSDGLTP